MIDFRSDTVTKPTDAMRKAMFDAAVGDDVYEDDLTIKELERLAATLTGKVAALFVPSGTMGNQIAIMTHTERGDEIIVGKSSHIKTYEVGAAAVLSNVSYQVVNEIRGALDPEEVQKGIRGEDIHYPRTSLICMENAHGSGVVSSLESMQAIHDIAKKHGIHTHLDGARLFNAAVHLNVTPQEIARYTDSVMFCLSKGLSSPIGSILAGSKTFIHRARKYRKMLGGGMRQVGVLGAPGLLALKEMTKRLCIDHENAQYLAQKLDGFKAFDVDFDSLDINMVFVKTSLDRDDVAQYMKKQHIILGGYKDEYMRLVCHNDITRRDIDTFIEAIHTYLRMD